MCQCLKNGVSKKESAVRGDQSSSLACGALQQSTLTQLICGTQEEWLDLSIDSSEPHDTHHNRVLNKPIWLFRICSFSAAWLLRA